jgi:hypothetical protein
VGATASSGVASPPTLAAGGELSSGCLLEQFAFAAANSVIAINHLELFMVISSLGELERTVQRGPSGAIAPF